MNNVIRRLWSRYAAASPEGGAAEEILGILDGLYSDPCRSYHGWNHIIHCITLVRVHADLARSPLSAESALWFHDAVYDPGGADNEARSAELCTACMREMGFDESTVLHAAGLVCSTAHLTAKARGNPDPDTALVGDVDLSILGSDPESFAAYERGIREEYAAVPEEEYRRRRSAVLEMFLSRESIFSSGRFRALYEERARTNIKSSLEALRLFGRRSSHRPT